MQKHVHLAFPIDNEDGPGEKIISKALEALARLKTVCQAAIAETWFWLLTIFTDKQRGPTICSGGSAAFSRDYFATVLYRG